jgi:exopolysaccharide biosynthesis polyprenyl glycosylphosphotransferase
MVTTRRYILLSLFKIFDLALLVGAFIAAAVPSLSAVGATSVTDFLSMRISVRNFVLFSGLLLLWHSLFSFFGLYESKRFSNQRREAIDVSKATSLGTLVLFLVGIPFNLSVIHPAFLAVFWLISTGTSVLSRGALRFLLKQIRQRGRNLRHVLIVGTNLRAVELAGTLEAHSALGYRVLGFVDREWQGMEEFRKTGYTCICDFKEISSFVRNSVVDEVMISLPISSLYSEISRIAALCEEQGITTHVLFSPFDVKPARAKAATSGYDSLITLHAGAMQGWALLVKRVLDIVISLSCIILFAPILLITAALIKLTSRGPIFFVQKRVGLNKRLISVYKFRTMVPNAEQKQAELEHLNEVGGPVFKIKNDPRVTRIGKFLRKTSIDELPQLFNVLKGNMSLVGPRPLPVRDYRGFNRDWQRRRFSIRPGITCLWQINGRSSVSFERWMELDLEYIDRWSVWLDLQILIRTIPAVLKGSGAA